MVPETRLPRIRELLEESVPANGHGEIVNYDVPGGPVIGKGLLNDRETAVQECFMPAGCTFPEHPHDIEAETLVVVWGKLIVNASNMITVLHPGQSINFDPGVVHQVTAVEDTRMIAVTVPGDEGYPNGRP